MRRFATSALLLAALAAVPASPALAVHPPEKPAVLAGLATAHPDLGIRSLYVPLDQLGLELRLPLAAELDLLGASPAFSFYDRRGARWGTLVLRRPLVPGAGNSLTWAELGLAPPADDEALGAEVWGRLAVWLSLHQAALGIDPGEVEPRVTVHEDGRLVQIHGTRAVDGVPVRRGYLAAVVNGGNLVLLGTRNWGDVDVSTEPTLSAADAAAVVAAHLETWPVEGYREAARLKLVPLAVGADPAAAPLGEGYRYRLAWDLRPRLADELGSWQALVDAHDGTLLLFGDANRYFDREVEGGVYPVANDGISRDGIPEGTEQPEWPMPFADLIQPFGTSTTANSAGLATGIGSRARTTLSGPFVRMADQCGPIDELAVCSDLDLGAGPGTDCAVPPGHSSGDTHASRTGFYEVNRIVEVARGWLPGNAWLREQLTSNMNIDQSCNAFWNGSTINFYTSGSITNSTGTFICGNTGESAGVFDHEWGHGLDDNDAVPDVSRPGETAADQYAFTRLNDSCIARGFWIQNPLVGNQPLCDGFGDPCLACSGVREVDWAKRQSGMPHDVAWILQETGFPGVPGVRPPGGCVGSTVPLPTISDGPCLQGTHCEGSVVSEAVWDLIHRDLRGFEGSAFSLDVNTSLNLVARLVHLGGGNVNEWYACDPSGALSGCIADGGFLEFLAADDDDGDLTNGTPHLSAIFAAFDRHALACSAFAAVADSGCAGGPASTPAVSSAATVRGASLSWAAVPGAGEYWVYKTDGIHGCEFGKERVAITSETSFSETGLKPDRRYFYTVEAIGSSDACRSPASACAEVVPLAPPAAAEPLLAFRQAADEVEILTGDGDVFYDNCEQIELRLEVENAGTADLDGVRVSAVRSPSHPETVVLTPIPLALGDLAAACGAPDGVAPVALRFVPKGVAPNEPFVLEFEVTADQLASPLVGRTTLDGTESDFELVASHTFGFEEDFEGWQIVGGTYTRESPGADGTIVHLASSSLQAGQCDEIRSPQVRLTAASTLSLFNQFVAEPGLPEPFYDRANVGLFDVETGERATIVPDGGRTYNASGPNGVCVTAGEPGWAGAGPGFFTSTWSAAALDAAGRAGRRLRLDVAYGTDPLLEGTGFQFDQVTLTDVELQVADRTSDVCPIEPNRPPVARDDEARTERGEPVTIAVLANDSDPDGDPLEVTEVGDPKHGAAAANPDGTVTYTPGRAGKDTFIYTISDGRGGTDDATVTIRVRKRTDDDDDHDDDGKRDDEDEDDDGDGVNDDADDDDDNDGVNDDADDDDDDDGIRDELDDGSARDTQWWSPESAAPGSVDDMGLDVAPGSLLLIALAEGAGAESLVLEIREPDGDLAATSVPAPGRALATAVPLASGEYTLRVKNPSAAAVDYELTLIVRGIWP